MIPSKTRVNTRIFWKAIFCCIIAMTSFQIKKSAAITISITSSVPNTLCSGDIFTVTFNVANTNPLPTAGNEYQVQISTAGNFSTSTIIGSELSTATGSHSIPCTIPAGQASSNIYRLRVFSTTPNGGVPSNVVTGIYINYSPQQPQPINGITGTTYGYCANTSGSFSIPAVSHSDPNGYLWYFDPPVTDPTIAAINPVNSTTNSITIDFGSNFTGPTTTVTIKVKANNCNGLSIMRHLIIKVTPAKPGVVTGPSAPELCTGVQYTYQIAPAGGAVTYNWSGPVNFCTVSDVAGVAGTSNVLTGSTSTTLYVTYTQPFIVSKNINVTAVNACGNSEVRSTSFANDVIQSPDAPIVTPAGPTTFCQGGSVTLNPNTPGGLTYTWYNGLVNVGTGTSYNATANGSYTVVAANASSCTAVSAPAVVTVNALPSFTLSANPSSLCPGGSSVISATPLDPAATYAWSGGAPSQNQTTVNSPGTYTVTVTDANSCSNNSSINISGSSLAVSISGNPLALCEGESTAISASVTGASGSETYLWSDGSTAAPPRTISPATTTPFSLTVTDQGCSVTSNTETITVNSLPTPVIVPTGSLCGGSPSVTLGTSSSYDAYEWSDGITTYTTSTIVTTVTGTFTVTVTDQNQCTGTGSFDLTAGMPVDILPVNTTICQGQNLTLQAIATNVTYLWSPNGETSANISVNTAGTYTVTVTEINGTCTGTASVQVVVNTPPTVSVTCNPLIVCPSCTAQLDATITQGSAAIANMIWTSSVTSQLAALSSTTIEDPVIDGSLFTTPATFTITIDDLNGCSATATTQLVAPIQMTIDATHVNGNIPYTVLTGVNTLNAVSGSPFTFTPSPGVPEITVKIPLGDGIKAIDIRFDYDPVTLNIDPATVELEDGTGFVPLVNDFFEIPADEQTTIKFFKDARKITPLNITTSLTNGIIQSSASSFQINIPSGNSFAGSSLTITHVSGTPTFTLPITGSTFTWNPGGSALGLYDFEVTLNGNSNNTPTTKLYKGQFILIQ